MLNVAGRTEDGTVAPSAPLKMSPWAFTTQTALPRPAAIATPPPSTRSQEGPVQRWIDHPPGAGEQPMIHAVPTPSTAMSFAHPGSLVHSLACLFQKTPPCALTSHTAPRSTAILVPAPYRDSLQLERFQE